MAKRRGPRGGTTTHTGAGVRMTVYLPAELAIAVKTAAVQANKSTSRYIAAVLRAHLQMDGVEDPDGEESTTP